MNPQESIATEQEALLSQHRRYLAIKWVIDPCYYNADLPSLSPMEANIIGRYGCWMGALAEGKIVPLTEAQRKFIEVCKGNKAPETEFEIACLKFKKRKPAHVQIFERDDYEPVYEKSFTDKKFFPDEESFADEESFSSEDDWSEASDDDMDSDDWERRYDPGIRYTDPAD